MTDGGARFLTLRWHKFTKKFRSTEKKEPRDALSRRYRDRPLLFIEVVDEQVFMLT